MFSSTVRMLGSFPDACRRHKVFCGSGIWGVSALGALVDALYERVLGILQNNKRVKEPFNAWSCVLTVSPVPGGGPDVHSCRAVDEAG